MTILVTGGAGFIGSNFIIDWLGRSDELILNLDCLTYAANLNNLRSVERSPSYRFFHCDIGDREFVSAVLSEHKPRAVINFAAESHVDRSVHGPADFIRTNVVGTFSLLEASRAYWETLDRKVRTDFRFLHVSTDEVYGSLEASDRPFTENTRYQPNSPYSASKAASDHLVRAWHHTYDLPVLTTNCSNNYGPYQYPEKLIPLMILNALTGKPLPLYGDGKQIRDWLYVGDHCAAIRAVLQNGRIGEVYNVGGDCEQTNLSIVSAICDLLDELAPGDNRQPHARLITHVADRPGHDRRYAVDFTKLRRELGWQPSETLRSGLRKTVLWYLENREWIEHVQSGEYRNWQAVNYKNR